MAGLVPAIALWAVLSCHLHRHSGALAARANPESRDSGFAAAHRPGM